MLAKDVMTDTVMTVKLDTPVPDIARMMAENSVSGLPVLDEHDCVVGMVSEDDLLLKHDMTHTPQRLALFGLWVVPEQSLMESYANARGTALARDVMTKHVVTFDEDADIRDIAQTMVRKRINRVPILKDCKLVGIVSRADILKAIADEPTSQPRVQEQIKSAL